MRARHHYWRNHTEQKKAREHYTYLHCNHLLSRGSCLFIIIADTNTWVWENLNADFLSHILFFYLNKYMNREWVDIRYLDIVRLVRMKKRVNDKCTDNIRYSFLLSLVEFHDVKSQCQLYILGDHNPFQMPPGDGLYAFKPAKSFQANCSRFLPFLSSHSSP